MIHEGTHGIQSLDLLGRKVAGPGFPLLIERMAGCVERAVKTGDDEIVPMASQLQSAVERLVGVTKKLGGGENGQEVPTVAPACTLLTLTQPARHTRLTRRTRAVGKAGDVQLMLANSHDYLNMAGTTVIGWLWLEMAIAAKAKSSDSSDSFLHGKVNACQFFMIHELSKTQHQARLLESLDDTVIKTKVEEL
jgi:butyryl-CoA dehydrogenase